MKSTKNVWTTAKICGALATLMTVLFSSASFAIAPPVCDATSELVYIDVLGTMDVMVRKNNSGKTVYLQLRTLSSPRHRLEVGRQYVACARGHAHYAVELTQVQDVTGGLESAPRNRR